MYERHSGAIDRPRSGVSELLTLPCTTPVNIPFVVVTTCNYSDGVPQA